MTLNWNFPFKRKDNDIWPARRSQGLPKNKGYIHVVEIESLMLHDKFHYHTILGCDVTDFKYDIEYGRGDYFVMCLDHLCKATHYIPNS